jgi:tRNA-dihydrouridine synthase B
MKLCNRIELMSPFVMAPLAGYTDLPFRKIVRRRGASLAFTELISAEGIVRKNSRTFKLMEISDSERPVGIQLFGKDPQVFMDAASITEERFMPDIIDINSGCCAPKVTSGDSGAALLNKPDTLYKIVSGVISRVKIPVSTKIRIGWDDKSKNYREIVSLLSDAGVSFITVHGRTRAQKYSGKADWDIITEIASFSKVPIIGNGDITDSAMAHERLRQSGCAAVMIGRAAIGNPWIFSGLMPSISERIDCAKEHLEAMLEYYGDYGLILSRKHLVNYFHGFYHAGNVRAQIVRATNPQEIFDLFERFRTELR